MTKTIENLSLAPAPQVQETDPVIQQPDAFLQAVEAEMLLLQQPGAVFSYAHTKGEVKTTDMASILSDDPTKPRPACLRGLPSDTILKVVATNNVAETYDFVNDRPALVEAEDDKQNLKDQAVLKERQETIGSATSVAEKTMPSAAVVLRLQRRAFEEQVIVTQITKPDVVVKKVTKVESKIVIKRITKTREVAAKTVAPKLKQIIAVKSSVAKLEIVAQPLKRAEQHKERSIVEKVEMLTIPPIVAPEHVIENDFEPIIIQEQFAAVGTILEEEPIVLTVPTLIQLEKSVDLDEPVMPVAESTIDMQLDNDSEIIVVAPGAELTVAEAEPMIFEESEALEFAEVDETVPATAQLLTALLAPNRQLETAGEQAEAAALVSEVVTAFLQELAPEQLVEIEAQIEQIVLVADRLHFLVENDAGDCEEALLIDAFLARKFSELLTEFEPILKALKITIDDETIAAFIANVRSVKYQSKADLLANFIEIQSEGTHEKKLFKEAGVFKKAQQASQIWQQNMQSMLGRITLNNAA